MRRLFAVAVAVAALASACSVTRAQGPSRTFFQLHPLSSHQKPLQISPGEDPVVAVVQHVRPAVVNVTTNLLQNTGLGFEPGKGVGTGFVIRSDGVIVTNYHVVEGAQRITVITQAPDTQRYSARVIGGDANADLAVLKIQAQGLPTATLGDSSKLLLGERVVAIGYALALEGGPTVTSGIVSALQRTIQVSDENCSIAACGQNHQRTYSSVIQTDAAINPGNSGGPLVNLAGEVVGIDTAGAGAANAENIGFAISIDSAKPTIEDALANPQGPVAFLGVSTQDVTPGLALQFGLHVHHGAYVIDVAPAGPAERAGVQGGDVIVSLDGKKVTGSDSLGSLIRSHKPGDQASVTVVDASGKRRTYTVTLGVNPLP
jgi:S1-C subfamily serine protease